MRAWGTKQVLSLRPASCGWAWRRLHQPRSSHGHSQGRTQKIKHTQCVVGLLTMFCGLSASHCYTSPRQRGALRSVGAQGPAWLLQMVAELSVLWTVLRGNPLSSADEKLTASLSVLTVFFYHHTSATKPLPVVLCRVCVTF